MEETTAESVLQALHDYGALKREYDGAGWRYVSEWHGLDEHEHQWEMRQNFTSRGYAMAPYEVCIYEHCDAARSAPLGYGMI